MRFVVVVPLATRPVSRLNPPSLFSIFHMTIGKEQVCPAAVPRGRHTYTVGPTELVRAAGGEVDGPCEAVSVSDHVRRAMHRSLANLLGGPSHTRTPDQAMRLSFAAC